jgi:AAA family ATP:ADP antiporter
LLSPVAELRDRESVTALLMFGYSFLAMAGYNVIKPATRSKYIKDLGADNLPFIMIAAGLAMGFVMQGYSHAIRHLPRRWAIPLTQAVIVAITLVFWALFHRNEDWVSAAFFFFGLLEGSLLISQFWTLANDVYDARQAKRIFGFIGAGSTLGGTAGFAIATGYAERLGTTNLLVVSSVILGLCVITSAAIVLREKAGDAVATTPDDEGVSSGEALRLLASSRHLQIIALVVSFAALGAAIIEQQLNMAVGELIADEDAVTRYLALVGFYVSALGFVIQVGLTSRIHRFLGVGFALMILPVSLGSSAILILSLPVLWSTTVARVLDGSLRYTIDKTTREILFLPLSTDLKYRAKPFVDVAVDRFAKGVGAGLALLIAIKVFHLTWWQLSYLSLSMTIVWVFVALRARREYLVGFRRSIEQRDIKPAEIRLDVADLNTIETLVEELAVADERRVVYAIELLDSLDKRNLITPLLLYHESPLVRARTLAAMQAATPDLAERWLPAVERMLNDPDADVRVAAVAALASIRQQDAAALMRAHLRDPNPRVVVTAAVSLAKSAHAEDVEQAEGALQRLCADLGQEAAPRRREVAAALAEIASPRLRTLLVSLIFDPDQEVAREAIRSAGRIQPIDPLVIPPLISLLRHQLLKADARQVLVAMGEDVLDALGYFMNDQEEDPWVRRHVPATLALIPSRKSIDLLMRAVQDPDGFLRFKAVEAIDRLVRDQTECTFNREVIEDLARREARHYLTYLSLHYNLAARDGSLTTSLVGHAIEEKLRRTVDRLYRLLGLLYPWKDVDAARWALEHGDSKARAAAAEYLDNMIKGPTRKLVLPVLEDVPLEEKVRHANAVLRTRVRDLDETVLHLVHDDDPVIAAAAIHLVVQRKMWQLASDVQHVLAHRDRADWFVHEAANWAIEIYRVTEGQRRDVWGKPLPGVEVVDRMRHQPLFTFVSIDELFRIASMARQVRRERGTVLQQAGTHPEAIHFLLDGSVALKERDGANRVVEPPAALGFEETLEGVPLRATARAAEPLVTLTIQPDELLTLLSENRELTHGVFRMLLEQHAEGRGRRGVVRGRGGRQLQSLVADGLTPIEKVLVLQEVPMFARASADTLVAVAAVAQEVKLEEGELLYGETDRSRIFVVVSGKVALESVDEPIGRSADAIAEAGDTIGVLETLGGIPPTQRARVVVSGRALRIDRETLFDVLPEHLEMMRGVYSALLHAGATTDRPA